MEDRRVKSIKAKRVDLFDVKPGVWGLTRDFVHKIGKAAGVKVDVAQCDDRSFEARAALGPRSAVASAPTADNASSRAVRMLLGLRATYTAEELKRPFVVGS